MRGRKLATLLTSVLLGFQAVMPVPAALASEVNSAISEEEDKIDLSYLAIDYDGKEQLVSIDDETELHLLGWKDEEKNIVLVEVIRNHEDSKESISLEVMIAEDEVIELETEFEEIIRVKIKDSDTFVTETISPLITLETTIPVEENENGTVKEQIVIVDEEGIILQRKLPYQYGLVKNEEKTAISEEEYNQLNQDVPDIEEPIDEEVEEDIQEDVEEDLEESEIEGETPEEETSSDVEEVEEAEETEEAAETNEPQISTFSATTAKSTSLIEYSTHIQSAGWSATVGDGKTSGTQGQEKRLEAIKIKTNIANLGVSYSTHVEKIGWLPQVSNNALSGTEGQAKRLEAIKINLTGTEAKNYDIYYRVHAQSYGWLGWAKNGESAGTQGFAKRLEAIEIKIVPKGQQAPGSINNSFIVDSRTVSPVVTYSSYVEGQKWQKEVSDGTLSGTSGTAKRIEAIQMKIQNLPGVSVRYSAHMQSNGWLDWSTGPAINGLPGSNKRLEAIKLELTGPNAANYDIYYRVHVQKFGWLGWAKNGAPAGSEEYGYRAEAIEVKVVPKGSYFNQGGIAYQVKDMTSVVYSSHVQTLGWLAASKDGKANGTVDRALRMEAIKISLNHDQYSGGITYRTHVESHGWMNSVSNGQISGTEGQAKQIEAIEINLTGEIAKHYDVYYRVHSQTYGWLGWAKNGMSAGTEGMKKRVENIEIKLVEKGLTGPAVDANKAFKKYAPKVVFIDVGHGGSDSGANYYGVKEKDLNMQIAKRVEKHLKAAGFKVILSRTSDVYIDHSTERSRMANASGADIFISLHNNAMPNNANVNGIETFWYQYDPDYQPVINKEMHNDPTRLKESQKLAEAVQNALISSTGAFNRGVQRDTFAVLRETSIPAILVEFGFMSNLTELNKLQTSSYQETLAKALTNGVVRYFN